MFFPGCAGSVLSSPIIHPMKKADLTVCFFHGVDDGARTHDLQSHNLTP